MKTIHKLSVFTLLAALGACSGSDDDGFAPIDPNPQGQNVLSGAITTNTTLDSNLEYTISGSVLVNEGVTLTIPAGTEIVSEVGNDNFLAVLKGGDIDIQGTEANPVIMRSNGQAGSWGGLVICGDATSTEGVDAIAEVGGLLYGGTNDNDSSGNIDYLIIQDSGAQINADSQFNGLSLYGVGDETTIDNVAIVNGTDDGVEFFGGTVNVTNLYLENLQDDAVDWTEGWNGTLTNTLLINTLDDFSTAIEADGVNNNPTLVNFTGISSTGGLAIQIKNDSGATINGLTLTGFDTSFDFRDDAPVANLQINGEDADTADDAVFANSPINASDFAWATDALNTIVGDLPANITSDLVLDANIEYLLDGPVLVSNGAELTIPAGTRIVSTSGTANYLAVLKGATIDIQGTMGNPVVMESNDGNAWGGLIICGDATTTEGVDAIAEVGGLLYGGTNDNDGSGNIDYLILRNTGAQINADSQFNGLTLYAVGDDTTIDNVAVIGGSDDGVEFFGGTVNMNNFYAENLEDDAVDWTEGWNGTLTNTFVNITIENFSTAIEADGENNNPTLVNFTAVSTMGGTAIQIKNDSGATIDGLSLTGFDTQFDFRDSAPLSNLPVDGANVIETNTFDSSTTTAAMFSWATSN